MSDWVLNISAAAVLGLTTVHVLRSSNTQTIKLLTLVLSLVLWLIAMAADAMGFRPRLAGAFAFATTAPLWVMWDDFFLRSLSERGWAWGIQKKTWVVGAVALAFSIPALAVYAVWLAVSS